MKREMSASTLIATLFMVLITVPLYQGNAISIEAFESNIGIFFENIDATSSVTTGWNLVVYYNLKIAFKRSEIVLIAPPFAYIGSPP